MLGTRRARSPYRDAIRPILAEREQRSLHIGCAYCLAHSPHGQTIYVTEGVGRCQHCGGPIEVFHPGGVVFFEPGEEHWHGAAPDRFMTHLAMLEVDAEGTSASWGAHVTDEEYGQQPSDS